MLIMGCMTISTRHVTIIATFVDPENYEHEVLLSLGEAQLAAKLSCGETSSVVINNLKAH